MLPPKIYSGSVKDIYGDKDQSPYIFSFTDKYSIYDWGEMPDKIPNKGVALSVLADLFFRFLQNTQTWTDWNWSKRFKQEIYLLETLVGKDLQKKGLRHHCLGLRGEGLQPTKSKSNLLAVKPIHVPEILFLNDAYDYSIYKNKLQQTLVPLEVIFRMGCPQGSSLVNRSQDNEYLNTIGLKKKPNFGERFEQVVVEFSTKLEPMDRYLSYGEAKEISGLSDVEMENLIHLTKLLGLRLYSLFESIGVELWDGKFEFAFADIENEVRALQLVDSIGPDELRLMYKDLHLSKEILRQAYQETEWFSCIAEAKKYSKENPKVLWQQYCRENLKLEPAPLDKDFLSFASKIYPCIVNELQLELGEDKAFAEMGGIKDLYNKFLEIKKQ